MRLYTVMTIEGGLVHVNPEHVVTVLGEDAADQVEIQVVTGVVYSVKQQPGRSIRAFLTGEGAPPDVDVERSTEDGQARTTVRRRR